MAEKEKDSSASGSWWGGLLAAAKHQTEKAMEMVSTDLAEFTCTMQTDTKKVVEKTKETLQTSSEEGEGHTAGDRVKHGFFSLMEGITKALTVDPEDTDPARVPPPQPGDGIFDRAKARLRAIQVDTGTYLNEPSGSQQLYADWLKSFDIEAYKGEISELLVSMVEVRSLYTTLVPSEVSHKDFWRRYFYKLHQLSVDEARKQALMRRAERANVKDESISWDEEDEWSGDEGGPRPEPAREDPSSRLQPGDSVDNGDIPSGISGEREDTTHEEIGGEVGDVKDKQSEVEASSHVKLKDAKTEKNLNVQSAIKSEEKTDVAKPTNVNQDKLVQSSEKGGKSVEHGQEKSSEADAQVKERMDDSIDEKSVKVSDTKDDKTAQDARKTEDKKAVAKEQLDDNIDEKSVKVSDTKDDNTTHDARGTEDEKAVAKHVKEPQTEASEMGQREVNDVSENTANDTSDTDGIEDGIRELKTKVKGDMVVVGDRISPSSESSGNKESVTEDWEQDFDDVEVTAEDLQAAHQLAEKLDMSAAEFNTLTGGEEEDWENWE